MPCTKEVMKTPWNFVWGFRTELQSQNCTALLGGKPRFSTLYATVKSLWNWGLRSRTNWKVSPVGLHKHSYRSLRGSAPCDGSFSFLKDLLRAHEQRFERSAASEAPPPPCPEMSPNPCFWAIPNACSLCNTAFSPYFQSSPLRLRGLARDQHFGFQIGKSHVRGHLAPCN